ncbi:MAG: radical SAM protein [Deltaproteobacteria bacterium]|nr:MAG: radical SAM protein [Deltaproteobacteria bacterium]
MVAKIDPRRYYRLPWTLTDNAISWLEVTTACNLACEGCYRDTKSKDGHKTLAAIAEELEVFKRLRNADSMSLAGGDPLVHPQIVEIVKMIHEKGWKPILNTNGLALTPALLSELKKAGAYGFTIHIDTSQDRPDANGATTEEGLNALRQKFAEMLAKEGGLSCSFNQTVTIDTLDQVPAVVRWAEGLPDLVHSIVFILYREPALFDGKYEYFAGGRNVSVEEDYKKPENWRGDRTVSTPVVVAKIREADPEFEPCAYLGGTVNPESTKWMYGTRLANRERGFGYVSSQAMEIIQTVHHLWNGTWLAYSKPETLAAGRASMFSFGTFDGRMRKNAWRFLRNALRHPRELFTKVHSQTIVVIQPIDLLPDGRADMCDGCPDITVHEGKLYWSCRLEEIKNYGCFVAAHPKQCAQAPKLHKISAKPQPTQSP